MVIYMKETGVIRRIDELGRIVIPKEIRKRLRVGPGDMLDIYTSDKQIVLSKYTELNEIDEHLLYLLKAFKNNHLDLIVTSSSDVIASTTNRISKHDVITEEFLNLFLKDGSISLTPSNQISLTKQVKFEKYMEDNNIEDNLLEYKERYNNICKYLVAKDKYLNIEKDIDDIKIKLDELYKKKDECEVDNLLLEETLISKFNTDTNGKYRNILYEDIKLIDDKEIETLNRALYYSHLAVVSYNTYLFNESIRDNFRLAKPTVKDEEIIKALKDVNMDEFVSSIGGLDYVIREDSANISGGQRQRLCLAINMVANKDIYVFDEATSNIDIDSEEIIINNIKALSKDKLVIIISHRLQNVVDCNRIFYLENGRIKEEGSHEELLSLNGSYNKLYSNQRSLEEGYKEVL